MEKIISIGIRKVQLIQSNISNGLDFYFKVNDVEMYMKGANLVPLDYYPDRMKSDEELEWIFLSAKEANFNIIRVWGGGMYMNDNFYNLADKHGMLIWQDMMFSCRFYPFMEDSFVESSKIEVRE
jgi:beta-mannosidase